MKAYYAHCMALYGTKQEMRDIVTIDSLGFEVENPNTDEHDKGFKKFGIVYAKKVIKKCDIVVFRALPDGAIPGGVYAELEYAKFFGKTIIELPSGILRRGLDKHQSREYLGEVGYR